MLCKHCSKDIEKGKPTKNGDGILCMDDTPCKDRARRNAAYNAINSERDYQEIKWDGNPHSITEYLVYMNDYINEAMHVVSRKADAEANPIALDTIRKVTALGVACMEQHGAPLRK